jgi:hypothetical protein
MNIEDSLNLAHRGFLRRVQEDHVQGDEQPNHCQPKMGRH